MIAAFSSCNTVNVGQCCKIATVSYGTEEKTKNSKANLGQPRATRHAEFLKGATSWFAHLKKPKFLKLVICNLC